MGGHRGETLPSPGPAPPGLAPSTLPDEGRLKGTVLIVPVLGFTQVLVWAGGFGFVLVVLAQTHLGPSQPNQQNEPGRATGAGVPKALLVKGNLFSDSIRWLKGSDLVFSAVKQRLLP